MTHMLEYGMISNAELYAKCEALDQSESLGAEWLRMFMM
jgi:hypothetical protein